MLKDILLVAQSLPADQCAIELAATVAAATGAKVRCLGINLLPDGFLGFSEGARTGAMARMIEEARREQDKELSDLRAALQARSPTIEMIGATIYPYALEASVADEAWRSDLVVARVAASSEKTLHARVLETALLAAGAPVLAAPLHWRSDRLGQRVLVAWDHSREAARAAHYALPLLAPDAQITVVSVCETANEAAAASARAFAAHLARGGMRAEGRICINTEGSIANTLDHVSKEIDADLVIMGGYRHARVQQEVFGGVTRDFLHAPPLPLLLAH